MTDLLIDLAVVAAVLVLTFEGGEILVRLMLEAIEPKTHETKPAGSRLEIG